MMYPEISPGDRLNFEFCNGDQAYFAWPPSVMEVNYYGKF